jgi:hypothetical protein
MWANKLSVIIMMAIFLSYSGCSYKRDINKSQSYLITIKMKNTAFNDLGFLNYGKDYTDLQLFSAGNLVLELTISNKICINNHCFDKKDFNTRFLSNSYNVDTLSNILNKKPIFSKVGYKKTTNGFMQNIKQNSLVIKYIVSKDKIYFKDFSNHIIIKLVKMENL